MRRSVAGRGLTLGFFILLSAASGSADPLNCALDGYKSQPGLAAAVQADVLTLTWQAERGREARIRLTNDDGTPTIQDLAARSGGGPWSTVVARAVPEFRVVTGLRRMSNQQIAPLRALGVDITQEIVDARKWDAFWDAPLDLSPPGKGGNPPPPGGIAHQPGLPRRPDEIRRASAVFRVTRCEVKTDGGRIEVSFPGVELGVFRGALQFTVYKGTSLLRVEMIAGTNEPSVAYKYDAGLRGIAVADGSRLVWRDLANLPQEYRFGGRENENAVPLKASNRVIAVEGRSGSLAAFPPPHTFFWTREVETNLGYVWYRKDADGTFAFGVRQAEREEEERYLANFSLYSAPQGSEQRMPMYLFVTADNAPAALEGALAFTRGDRYKPVPGYQVMASHFHMELGERTRAAGSLDTKLPDLEALRAAGINIVAPTDRPAGANRLEILADYYEVARRHSDENFLIMPNEEVSQLLGGHWDLLLSKPIFWTRDRKPGQPLVETDPTFGKVYRVGSPADVLEMIRRENALIFMPHPRTKGSTGYPDAVKDTEHFRDDRYLGVGWRWGMGLDLSERRLSDFRVLPLLDDMNNWMASTAEWSTTPKQILAITETYEKHPGDDIYANNPVNYIRLDRLPSVDDMSPLIDAIHRGDYFVTSGEVLIPSFSLRGTGSRRTITAEIEWTFPLDFVEVVWGDGRTTGRRIIPTTELPPFGRHRFEIPFDAVGQKWVRFAAWDSAGNGALVQPVKVQ
jgi:hypothetical protein